MFDHLLPFPHVCWRRVVSFPEAERVLAEFYLELRGELGGGVRKGIERVLPVHCSINRASALPGLMTTSVCRMVNWMHQVHGELGTYISEGMQKSHCTASIANLTTYMSLKRLVWALRHAPFALSTEYSCLAAVDPPLRPSLHQVYAAILLFHRVGIGE